MSKSGSYHYHCGGNPPHLHTNGVCPYASTTKKESTSSSSSSNAKTTTKSNTSNKINTDTNSSTKTETKEVTKKDTTVVATGINIESDLQSMKVVQ